MSKKVEFLTRLDAVKKRLPVGVVPLYQKAFPDVQLSRLKNTVKGVTLDEQILENLEALADSIEKVNN